MLLLSVAVTLLGRIAPEADARTDDGPAEPQIVVVVTPSPPR